MISQMRLSGGAAGRPLLLFASLMALGCVQAPVAHELTVATSTAALESGLACFSTWECPENEHCSTDDGECRLVPICGFEDASCYEVCRGACVANPPAFDGCRSDGDCFAWAGCDNCGACAAFSVHGPFPDCIAPDEGAMCTASDCDGREAFCNAAGACELRPRSSSR